MDTLYLDLIKRCLTRYGFDSPYRPLAPRPGTLKASLYKPVRRLLASFGLELVRQAPFDPAAREQGLDWPAAAETMVGLRRLDNVQRCVEDVLQRRVPGDFIETGVWRGGTVIFIRAVLKLHGDTDRVVWAADSFQGLPKPSGAYPADAGDRHWEYSTDLAVSVEQVKANFARYDMLDDQVRFLVGWFSETLPAAPIERLALLRLDGDMYESTIDALRALYPKLSVGGYAIIDDYGALPNCRRAVDDYRRQHDISEPIQAIDGSGVYWQRER